MGGFIAPRVFSNIPVQKKSDLYYSYPKQQWFRSDAQLRAPGTESAGSGYELDTDQYSCDVFALHKNIDDQLRANADAPIDLDKEATEFVARQLMLKREKDWASSFFAASTWTGSTTGGDVTPGTLWSAGGSDPFGDMRAEVAAIHKKTGYKPNKAVMGREVWDILADHPDFLERIKYTQTGIVGPDLLAAALGLDEVLIGFPIEDTAAEGATEALDYIYGKNVLFCYSAPRPGLMTPSAGYTFSWSAFGGNDMGIRMKRFRMEQLEADRVEGSMAYDMKLVAPDLGAFMTGVVA